VTGGGSPYGGWIMVRAGLCAVLALVLIAAGCGHQTRERHYRVPSGAMEPTMRIGEIVTVNLDAYKSHEPSRGDIVVFKPPKGADDNACGVASEPIDGHPCEKPTPGRSSQSPFIKRIVALGGDKLKVLRGRVYLNGKLQNEPLIRPDDACVICNLPKQITVPPGYVFVMGDNRGQSADSRLWGPVPTASLVGRVVGK